MSEIKEIQKAIEIVNEILNPCHGKCEECVDYEYLGEAPHGEYICDSLEYQASKAVVKVLEKCLEEKQERERGWIPVSERLPENKARVLVTRAIGIVDIGFCNRNSNNEWRDGGGYKMDIPTAWQPLPEPYKEG